MTAIIGIFIGIVFIVVLGIIVKFTVKEDNNKSKEYKKDSHKYSATGHGAGG